MLDPVEFGKRMAAVCRELVAPLEARIAALEGRDPVKELLSTDKLETLVSLEVAAWLEANPPEKGEKGDPGQDGAAGQDGKDGRDGLDVKGLFREEGGHLIAVMSDGTTKDLGRFVGKDGKDGLGFEDASLEVSDGTATLKFQRGDLVKSVSFPFPTMKHIGFWQGGMSAKACETTTHDGSLWIALRDTKETPSYQSKDWQLAARKGADGQHAKDAPPPQPVKLNGTR